MDITAIEACATCGGLWLHLRALGGRKGIPEGWYRILWDSSVWKGVHWATVLGIKESLHLILTVSIENEQRWATKWFPGMVNRIYEDHLIKKKKKKNIEKIKQPYLLIEESVLMWYKFTNL